MVIDGWNIKSPNVSLLTARALLEWVGVDMSGESKLFSKDGYILYKQGSNYPPFSPQIWKLAHFQEDHPSHNFSAKMVIGKDYEIVPAPTIGELREYFEHHRKASFMVYKRGEAGWCYRIKYKKGTYKGYGFETSEYAYDAVFSKLFHEIKY